MCKISLANFLHLAIWNFISREELIKALNSLVRFFFKKEMNASRGERQV
jgi:hypothetical protein